VFAFFALKDRKRLNQLIWMRSEMDMSAWLHELGLEKYDKAFQKHAISAEDLPMLSADDLKEIGVDVLGHRHKILAAIRALDVQSEKNSRKNIIVNADINRHQIDLIFDEVRNLISHGNNVVAVFLLGAIVWWFANLFPYDLSERNTGTADERLSELKEIAGNAESACQSAHDQFINDINSGLLGNCIAPQQFVDVLQVNRLSMGQRQNAVDVALLDREASNEYRLNLDLEKSDLGASVEFIDEILVELARADNCSASIINWRKTHFEYCAVKRGELTKYVEEIAKQGSLEVAGLKISNIHPKWHALVLLLIILAACIWIGAKRRRIFSLLNKRFTQQHEIQTLHKDDLQPMLLTMPWWLWPVPRWTYGTQHYLFSDLVASRQERQRILITIIVVVILLMAMLLSALFLELRVSAYIVTESQRDLADLDNTSFSLTGTTPTDLALLSGLFAAAIAVFAWSPHQESNTDDALAGHMSQKRRAVLLVRLRSVAAIALTAVVTPILMDLAVGNETSKKFIDNYLQRVGIQRKPRFRHSVALARFSGPAGWYRNLASSEQHSTAGWIGHYVRPAETIRGAGGLNTSKLEALPIEDLLASEPSAKTRLNRSYYSEGIENLALERWRAGAKEEAVKVLRTGLNYASRQYPINLRLFDLTAGLLVRAGQEPEINSLINDVTSLFNAHNKRIDRAHATKAHFDELEIRFQRWKDPNGRWRSKWQPDQPRKWNGIDI
jgi:hypothetical protein